MDTIIRWRSLLIDKWRNEIPCQIKVLLTGDKQLYVRKEFVESYVYKLMSTSYFNCSSYEMNYDKFVQMFNEKNYLFFNLFNKLFYNEYVSYSIYDKDIEQLMARLKIPTEIQKHR